MTMTIKWQWILILSSSKLLSDLYHNRETNIFPPLTIHKNKIYMKGSNLKARLSDSQTSVIFLPSSAAFHGVLPDLIFLHSKLPAPNDLFHLWTSVRFIMYTNVFSKIDPYLYAKYKKHSL